MVIGVSYIATTIYLITIVNKGGASRDHKYFVSIFPVKVIHQFFMDQLEKLMAFQQDKCYHFQ